MPETIPLRSPASLSALRNRRILVVEDEYVVAQDLRHELEEAGAQVLGPMPSVTSALALLDGTTTPDAAILDVNLRGEMVFPVAEALRERGVPFVFTTGYDRSALPLAYAEAPYCVKPIDVGRCMSKLLA